MQPAAIVINSTLARDLGRFRRRCREAAAAGGWEPSFLETTLDDRGPGLAGAAVAAGARMVVAAGGDGTVRACAQALAGTQVPLAIVPLGTANLAARALGIPSRIGGSLATAFGGHERRIDLAVAGGAVAGAAGAGAMGGARAMGGAGGLTFAAMAGIGLDAEVVAATPRLLKRRAGWLAYAAAGIAHLPGRGERFTVRLDDDEPLARQARCVVVGNAGLLPGGFALLPQARLDDGLLDVGILAPAGPAGWLRVAHQVLSGGGRDGRQLERHQARRVEIRTDTELPREVDGEVIAPGRSLTVTLLRRALTVRVPPPGS
ncbi:MAG TPA: diacylglycerol kinase family protein [Streptosporangiaceae bacterium]|nr:diacylglycerol kinase family protein [Streptosporangiaceae bacterium]